MNDAYAEWLVKRKTPVYSYVINGFMVFVTVICVFLALITNIAGVIAMFLAGGTTYFLIRNTNVEFEYLYVTGQLSIDKILGRSKRKKAWECSMDEIQIIAPADSYMLKDYQNQNTKVMDFTSGQAGNKVYAVIANSRGQSVKVLIEPNDKMLQCFRRTAPRKVIQ